MTEQLYRLRTLYTQRPKESDDPTMQGLVEVVDPGGMVAFVGNPEQAAELFEPIAAPAE